jgi:hypothetical protein
MLYVNNIIVQSSNGQMPDNPPGFPYRVNVDFNQGAGGDYVDVFYSMGDQDAITDLRVSGSDDRDEAKRMARRDGYILVAGDLNQHAGGEYIYISFSRDASRGKAITQIGAFVSSSRIDNKPYGWDAWSATDCNRGAGGQYIYLVWNLAKISQTIETLQPAH